MQPRFKQQDDDGGLDSLLDTMTNVVGILVLVLIATQVGVKDKVESIMAQSDVTEDDVRIAEADLSDQREDLRQLQQQAASVSTIDIEAERQRLQRMQEQLATARETVEQQTQTVNEYSMQIETDQERAAELEKEVEDTKARRRELETAIQQALTQRADLKSQLDETRKQAAPQETVLRIPNPRPAPEGAQEATFICTGQQLFPLRLQHHRRYAEQAGKKIITDHQLNLNPAAGIDAAQFTELFTQLEAPVDDEFFRAEYYVADNRWPRIRLHPREDQGAPLKALTRPGTNIRKLIASLSPQQYFCRFHVLPDSFEVYMAARRAVTIQQLPAGWEPQPAGWILTTSVPGIELGPPRPKPPPPANPPPPRKPANLID